MSLSYIQGRQRYARPQAMLWANNPGTTVEDGETGEIFHIPLGNEVGSAAHLEDSSNEFIILSDHNRGDIDFSPERIETRKRMINGRMRSYHIADKLSISTSWEMLPSRAYHEYPDFDSDGSTEFFKVNSQEFTADGGAGGMEILDWYDRYTGSFWLYLSYDKYKNFSDDQYNNLNKYSQVIEVFFSDFSYNVVKRGGSNFFFWNISLGLEEV